jgi:Type III secretion system subunit
MDKIQEITASDAPILRLYRRLWQPARYAHPNWFIGMGFHPPQCWQYGRYPVMDRILNEALRRRRGTPRLTERAGQPKAESFREANYLETLALALGLLMLNCKDYFLLPAYRQTLSQRVNDVILWQLFGLCTGVKRAVFTPQTLQQQATEIGLAGLYRIAEKDAALYASLVALPPRARALRPGVSRRTFNLLEQVLCANENFL